MYLSTFEIAVLGDIVTVSSLLKMGRRGQIGPRTCVRETYMYTTKALIEIEAQQHPTIMGPILQTHNEASCLIVGARIGRKIKQWFSTFSDPLGTMMYMLKHVTGSTALV